MEGDTPLRQLPSVESLLQRLEADGALAAYPRGLVVAAARDAVARARTALREGRGAGAPVSVEGLVDDARGLLARRAAPSLVSAVNATGIIIHTNLGRAPLCDAVVLDPSIHGQATLVYLERANLFLVALDDERRWYRYHHLFAELLRQRLRQQPTSSPGNAESVVNELHIRASVWYEEQGLDIEAFHHATAAHDIERAERLVEGKWMPLHFRGAVAPVLNWLKLLPPAVLNARPVLCTAYASTLLASGQNSGVEERDYANQWWYSNGDPHNLEIIHPAEHVTTDSGSIDFKWNQGGSTPASPDATIPGSQFLGAATAVDVCDPTLTIGNNAPPFFNLGTTSVQFSTVDDSFNQATCSASVNVVDTTPPTIASVAATPNTLWPPNHKMVAVNVAVSVSDVCSGTASCQPAWPGWCACCGVRRALESSPAIWASLGHALAVGG